MSVDLLQSGLSAFQAGDMARALQCFETLVEREPGNSAARVWLGQVLCALGRVLEGRGQIRQGGEEYLNRWNDPESALEALAQLQRWSDFEGAVGLSRAIASAHPGLVRAQQLLAVTCGQLNLTDEALEAGARALALEPDHPMMQVLQGSLEADAGRLDDADQRLATLLLKGLPDREAFRAHKEMARIQDGLGEYDDVFPHLAKAAAIARRLPEVAAQNMAMIPFVVRNNTDRFTTALTGRWAGTAFDEPTRPRHVFVVGFFRSGTTLTQEVLGAHPDVFVADEAHLVWEMQKELSRIDATQAPMAEKLARLDQAGIERLRQAYWDAARARYADGVDRPVFVDKFTMNTLDLGLINTVFPDAKVIFVMRDPRDVCLSCHMQLMVPSPATVHLLEWRETGAFYGLVMNWWLHIRERLTMDWMELRYEDAIADFGAAYGRIFEFLGLPWDPSVRDFHLRAKGRFIASPSRNQVSKPLYSTSVAKWRRYEDQFPAIADEIAPSIQAFGYDA